MAVWKPKNWYRASQLGIIAQEEAEKPAQKKETAKSKTSKKSK